MKLRRTTCHCFSHFFFPSVHICSFFLSSPHIKQSFHIFPSSFHGWNMAYQYVKMQTKAYDIKRPNFKSDSLVFSLPKLHIPSLFSVLSSICFTHPLVHVGSEKENIKSLKKQSVVASIILQFFFIVFHLLVKIL